jgi:hypothetical protein
MRGSETESKPQGFATGSTRAAFRSPKQLKIRSVEIQGDDLMVDADGDIGVKQGCA